MPQQYGIRQHILKERAQLYLSAYTLWMDFGIAPPIVQQQIRIISMNEGASAVVGIVFWSLSSLVRNSVVLAVYLLFSVACSFTVHEHFHKVHNLIKSGSAFHKRKLLLNHLFSESILYWELSFQGSFKNGVVSTSLTILCNIFTLRAAACVPHDTMRPSMSLGAFFNDRNLWKPVFISPFAHGI